MKWNVVVDPECGICLECIEPEGDGVYLYNFSSIREAKQLQKVLETSNAKVGQA